MDIRSEITFYGDAHANFQLYIRRYTSPNENFEYSYPQINYKLIVLWFEYIGKGFLLSNCIDYIEK